MQAAIEPDVGSAAAQCWQYGGDVLATLDPDQRVMQANPTWSRLLGLQEGALSGRPFCELLHPRDVARATDGLASARVRQAQGFDARCRHARGHYVLMNWTLARTPAGLLLVSGREAPACTHTQPPGADDAAERQQRILAVGRLAGGIAHEFNNLLQTLRNALELVRRQPGDAAGVQRLSECALRALDDGTRLTAQLLASSAAQQRDVGVVPLVPLLRSLHGRLQRSLPPHLRLQMQDNPDAGCAMVDRAQFESAVLQLVLNAADAMADAAPGSAVTVSCERVLLSGDSELPTGEYVRLAVSDGGAGMSESVRDKVFEPFFSTRPLSERGHRRGLGLSQVHAFTCQSGGSTRIERTGPGGTTVSMLLPLMPIVASLPAASVPPGEPGMAKSTLPAAPQPVALVVADDRSSQRTALCEGLRLLGYRAVPAADGPTALAAMQRHAASVVLIDKAMPGRFGCSGDDLARRMRLAWPEVGVVLVGVRGAGVDPEEGPAELAQPFDQAALSRAVGRVGGHGAAGG